jgi:hypothetical protein
MEPISGVEQISKQRWKLVRYLHCKQLLPAFLADFAIEMFDLRHSRGSLHSMRQDFLLFGISRNLCKERKVLDAHEDARFGACALDLFLRETLASKSFHWDLYFPGFAKTTIMQPEQRKIRNTAIESGQLGEDIGNSPKLGKTARAYAKTYKPGPPLVPKFIVERILQYIGKISVRKKQDFLHLLCKYWSLKREARRGAPLLKRLHLEPWTASSANKQHSEKEKAMKLEV